MLGDSARYQSVRDHMGRRRAARIDRRRFLAALRRRGRAHTQVTVCCGSTEAMLSTMLAVLDPGDEVVIFEPFYENYGPDASSRAPFAALRAAARAATGPFDPTELAAAFNDRTRAIIINTPNNPTGKVFTRSELQVIARALSEVGCARHHRRDLRAHYLRRAHNTVLAYISSTPYHS